MARQGQEIEQRIARTRGMRYSITFKAVDPPSGTCRYAGEGMVAVDAGRSRASDKSPEDGSKGPAGGRGYPDGFSATARDSRRPVQPLLPGLLVRRRPPTRRGVH